MQGRRPPLKASSFSEEASFSLLPEKKPVTLSCKNVESYENNNRSRLVHC